MHNGEQCLASVICRKNAPHEVEKGSILISQFFPYSAKSAGSFEDFIFSGLTDCFVTAKIKPLAPSYHTRLGVLRISLNV